MAYPPGATDRTVFEGKRTTERTVLMIKEARYLYKLRGGGKHPSISQGGWSTSVTASGNTHAQDALDDATRTLSHDNRLRWELCKWEVGFASWRRGKIRFVWPAHDHDLPKGGQLSDAADRQIVQWFQGDNALKSDKPYPRILSSGFVARTWEKYVDLRPSGNVDLSGLVSAFQTGDQMADNDVEQVQAALNHFLDSKLAVDGIAGPATKGVYETYQSRLYGIPKDHPGADGIPGRDSLTKLGFTVTD